MRYTLQFSKPAETQPEAGVTHMDIVGAFATEVDTAEAAIERCRALNCWPLGASAIVLSEKTNPCKALSYKNDEIDRLLSKSEYHSIGDRQARDYADCVRRSTTPGVVLCDRTLSVCCCQTQLEAWQAFWDGGAYLNEQFKHTTRDAIPTLG
jgi:hypothetical protein